MNITLVAQRDKWIKAGESIVITQETRDGKQSEVLARFTMPEWDTPTRYIIEKLEVREYDEAK